MLEIYSIRDALIGFGPVLLEQNRACAVRNFTDLVNTNTQLPVRDYSLFYLGSYNFHTGIISPVDNPEFVCDACSVLDPVAKGGSSDETQQSE
ncbi:nonstructural protein [Microvirus mar25]|uniref:Nonstructural protein n=1 Tax=Microvirus mar25 TaxID=2851158 RepID=A0A8F5MIV7_9VIRU|nr:nonstructural protein [Microvirus mar25]